MVEVKVKMDLVTDQTPHLETTLKHFVLIKWHFTENLWAIRPLAPRKLARVSLLTLNLLHLHAMALRKRTVVRVNETRDPQIYGDAVHC